VLDARIRVQPRTPHDPFLRPSDPRRDMRILTLNPGSSSMKAALIADGATLHAETWAAADAVGDESAVHDAIERWGRPDAVAIRFVHGGSRPGPVLADEDLLRALGRLAALAPLHQPLSVEVAQMVRSSLPDLPIVAAGPAGRGVLRHRVPQHASRGRAPLRPAACLDPAEPAAPVRVPRPVLRVRHPPVRGAAGHGGGGAAAGVLSHRVRGFGDRHPRRGERGYVDGIHAHRGRGDGHPVRLGRPRPAAARAENR
jgi:hypothetical protein